MWQDLQERKHLEYLAVEGRKNKTNFKELGLQSEVRTYMALDEDQWRDHMNTNTMFGHNQGWKIY